MICNLVNVILFQRTLYIQIYLNDMDQVVAEKSSVSLNIRMIKLKSDVNMSIVVELKMNVSLMLCTGFDNTAHLWNCLCIIFHF